MCLPIAKYKKIISTLETEIYPSFIKKLKELLIDSQNIPEYQSPVQLEKIQLIVDLKTELCSLQSYETKLIFPVVISLLNNKTIANVNIDFNQVSQLTKFKEDKIEKYSYQLQGLNNCHEAVNDISELNVIVDIFLDEIQTKLLPLKRQWSFMLNALANERDGQNSQCGNKINTQCGGCKKE